MIIEDVTREDLLALLNAQKGAVVSIDSVKEDEPKQEVPVKVDAEEVQEEKTETEEKPIRRRRRKKAEKKEEEKAAEPQVEDNAAEAEEVSEDDEAEEKAEEATPQVSRTDVINLGKKLVKEGHSKDVTKLMKDTYGATKFSDITDDQLPEVYKAFKEIENAA